MKRLVRSSQTFLQDVWFDELILLFACMSHEYKPSSLCSLTINLTCYVMQGRTTKDPPKSSSSMKGVELVQSSKKESVIEKTLEQIKETSTVWMSFQASWNMQLCFHWLSQLYSFTICIVHDLVTNITLYRNTLTGRLARYSASCVWFSCCNGTASEVSNRRRINRERKESPTQNHDWLSISRSHWCSYASSRE